MIQKCTALSQMIIQGDKRIVVQEIRGGLHFNPQIDSSSSLRRLAQKILPADEVESLAEVYERVFRHRKYTGRSSSMFAYEGIGCIYWHMIGKLLVAIQGNLFLALRKRAQRRLIDGLIEKYYEIRSGMGFNKQPEEFGAFPLDPYSHTPRKQGARQPGLSGQVKEAILTRWKELGIVIEQGRLMFVPVLLRKREFLECRETLEYIDTNGKRRKILLQEGDLGFTFCQIPIVYRIGENASIEVELKNAEIKNIAGFH
ncbi:MAG: hypothetical protein ACUVQ7_07490 [bacterium]